MSTEAKATWKDIKDFVNSMSEEELGQTATVCDTDMYEFYPIYKSTGMAEDDDAEISSGILDDGHHYLRF